MRFLRCCRSARGFAYGSYFASNLSAGQFMRMGSSPATIASRETMPNLASIMKQLRKERDHVEKRLSGLNAALTAFANVYGKGKPTRKRRKMSAAARRKIAAAQRARWARFRAKRKS